ncbi:MAG: FixH family protein [Kibdelosporangium sp.]
MRRLVFTMVAVVVLAALSVTLLPGADPLRLSRSGVTVSLDRAGTGVVAAQVEVAATVATVSLSSTMPQMGHMTSEIVANKEEPGHFRATGELFAMAGSWELTVRADRAVVTFEITVE